MHFLSRLTATAGVVTVVLLASASVLHLIVSVDRGEKKFSAALRRAPVLDWLITYFMIFPLIVCPAVFGWSGILGSVVGQVLSVNIWMWIHEWTHPQGRGGPRIMNVLNRLIGRWRNQAALWLTVTISPVLWLVRMVEVFAYPPLRLLVGFPRYDQGEWVNLSRQKFNGLVGHDLLWCLYCDWMTGIWSLGSEMLRNVESFWCPIRFDNTKKCENCSKDFPDLENGWVSADGTMQEVADVLDEMHSGGFRGWFGHPVRITVKGNDIAVPLASFR